MNQQELLDFARQVIHSESEAVRQMTAAIDQNFDRAAQLILACRGAVITTGIGKAGHVARKIAATFASTGTPSHYLSTADAVHGDLGSVRNGDLVVIMSFSGESDEILRLLNLIKKLDHPVIAMTASKNSGLGKFADVVLEMGQITEACPLGLAPSASTTAMLALGDALALSVMKLRNFTAEDFAVFHPAGQLGRRLIKVREAMTFRKDENLPVASDALTVRQIIHHASNIKRRPGAVILVDTQGKLSGLFTDADFRRLLTDNDGSALNRPISSVMTHNPRRISADALASEAMAIMRQTRFDELPVVDENDRPVGIIDVQDLVVLKMFDVEPGSSS
ncbi:MAG TPA: KpsF/GutQ family sugar-phosphate isomerase [Tepidisphaeraceae bacterium]|nr:KpsF/GutQ family sugar-phosphate isomerase [Tepidisphaeraceae bacterium]